MKTWNVTIIEGQAFALEQHLTAMTAAGWVLFNVLPNGINRWTVVMSQS
jgi:hypothetical protein